MRAFEAVAHGLIILMVALFAFGTLLVGIDTWRVVLG